jgi:porphobilinogen synthase
MDYNNSKESLREVALDLQEGADFVMVKPGMPYLDIIKLIKDTYRIPVFAYQVSGEYSMIRNSINNKIFNEDIIYESLISLKRAGASAIVTYFADEIASKLR